jgi:methyltransferase (TIGR00027 family)
MPIENPLLTMIREVCALGRAEFDRPRTATGDADAQRALVAGLTASDPDGVPSDIALSLDLLAPRAPFFDTFLQRELDAGITQIVNLGAGYDDRALRFRSTGVTFFDVDLPHVVADKARRLEGAGIDTTGLVLVAADLESDDLVSALASAGHDAEHPTLFIAEHLALFLAPASVRALVAAAAARAATGSLLALTAEVHPAGLESDAVIRTVDEVMFGGVGPLRTILTRDAWAALLAETGWSLDDAATGIPTPVDHFPVPIDGAEAQIQTHFLSARR